MAKFIIIVRSHLPLVFQSRVLATTPIPNGIYKFWPEPVFVFAMQIYAPPISQPIRTSARQPISTFNNPPISGSPGGHSPGLLRDFMALLRNFIYVYVGALHIKLSFMAGGCCWVYGELILPTHVHKHIEKTI